MMLLFFVYYYCVHVPAAAQSANMRFNLFCDTVVASSPLHNTDHGIKICTY